MSKKIKLFIVTGIFVDFEKNKDLTNELHCIVGYFTNLKELYGNFQPNTIQSYSTICSHINKHGYYISKESRFWHRREYEDFNEIIIREVETNQLYATHKYISLSELLSKEVSSIDVHLGMNLSRS
ncbi:MAG: hypothetical protein JXB49_17975 [Bacteroidales bacterium]|nr:hypothetical protein [Bacteroidales bacterium]